jgi:transposase-like protein
MFEKVKSMLNQIGNIGSPVKRCPECGSSNITVSMNAPRLPGRMPGGPCRIRCKDCGKEAFLQIN